MEGANADSDHSMTWEDFFGSTTDLTPTLIGIYDSLLEPSKRPEVTSLEKAKDARNDPPVDNKTVNEVKCDYTDEIDKNVTIEPLSNDPTNMASSIKLPVSGLNKSSLYSLRTMSDKNGASDEFKCDLISSETILVKDKTQRTFSNKNEISTFTNLSPNVKRMISSATETTGLKYQKKLTSVGRSSMRKTNLPLVGATSKISQSGVEIISSVDIYDQPNSMRTFGKVNEIKNESPLKNEPIKVDFKLNEEQTTYDVPKNNRPSIYDIPNSNNKTAFESLSLPYIDQSIEASNLSNDREFDVKISPKENSPEKLEAKPIDSIPSEISSFNRGTNSLHRNDFVDRMDNTKNLPKSSPYSDSTGSTGNLKLCAISEKERIKFNPPTVEVSRPLSMSSITSSSSTSSSGIQNKGGVNSAYLASIESLDDHSDADIMVSANGSNDYVNSTGITNNNISEERNSEKSPRQDEVAGLSQLERVCAEIVQTENVYVEDLRQVVEGYLNEWRRMGTFSFEELSELFNNIEDIYAFNRSLCEELNTCRLDATCIARCFVNNTAGFSVYTSYCTGYPRTMERLAALASTPHSAREFRERQLALGHPLPLASYLLKPVQRILKYHLLLQNVVKQCSSSDTEYALLKMTGIAQHIDEMKRRHEHAVRVQEIQSLLYGWYGPDLTTYGELCAEGTFRVFGAKAMRHVFLFDKMLLVTKNREDGILAYKSHIMCNNMMLVESIAGAALSFHVIPWDAPRSQLTLQARSHRHKREWTLLLKRVILENYNAVIPSHARQLVMELGQNKTDDDMIAEKSHSLITQASMRKQLSAPEYLEKRKMERERRKSIENGIRGRFKKVNRKYIIPSTKSVTSQECDCIQVSFEKGMDYTCDNCYVDLCSDCEAEISNRNRTKEDNCSSKNEDVSEDNTDKCAECDKGLQYIDSGSLENLDRKPSNCKCSELNSSQESFNKAISGCLNKTRGYHSSDNIVSYTKSIEDLTESNSSTMNVSCPTKSCLKCSKIKENIEVNDSMSTLKTRRARCINIEKQKDDMLRSKSKEDTHRSKLTKIGTWRRKSEPGLQQTHGVLRKSLEDESDKTESKFGEKIEFECRNCGSSKITRKKQVDDVTLLSDPEMECKQGINLSKPMLEIKMYNTKNMPKKISELKKIRAKSFRVSSHTTAKFYTDFNTGISTENILHISESNDSLNTNSINENTLEKNDKINKDSDIDEETYRKLIEKTDSFKKNELEKGKFLSDQKIINEDCETVDDNQVEGKLSNLVESGEDEQPLEKIISQLLMQNREFQKLLKKQQQRNSSQRRHQRLLKSHSTPESVVIRNNDLIKLKPKFVRQISENLTNENNFNQQDVKTNANENQNHIQAELENLSEDDHVYETLRVDVKIQDKITKLDPNNSLSKEVDNDICLPSPTNSSKKLRNNLESDYVYLTFEQINKLEQNEVIYDVPKKIPEKVTDYQVSDYYVAMENNRLLAEIPAESNYDKITKVRRRKKDVPEEYFEEYLPMSSDQQSPNNPEIWLTRQKEHFNISSDRKSGSLPRSFQVPNTQEDNTLGTFKSKSNNHSKTYLNKDGKVMNIERPFTIASDQSEMSYDEVENYINEVDRLQFNKKSVSDTTDYVQNISQSTLELEEEIDRCYKNNFENDANLDSKNNESLTSLLQPNLNNSITSSCELLSATEGEGKSKVVSVIHPDHKIYKPTTNILSLKNVLGRFKTKSPHRNTSENEINIDEQSPKSDMKSPTNEKRAALNPRNYSKNLLQRFRSIISDENTDDIQNKSDTSIKTQVIGEVINETTKKDIQVAGSNNTTTKSNLDLSPENNIFEDRSAESQTDNNFESLSKSCEQLSPKSNSRSVYEESMDTKSNFSSSNCNTFLSKSNKNSYQNKSAIYMQGSKYLGARIAQSDYEDPMKLIPEKLPVQSVNVLINKNSVRPDSLFSNSSFATSSSESTCRENHPKFHLPSTVPKTQFKLEEIQSKEKFMNTNQTSADESYYEKTFEKIEQVTDDEIFRDSAVYSDQEEDDSKLVTIKFETKINSQVVKRNEHLGSHIPKITNQLKNVEINVQSTSYCNTTTKSKIAPPVPVKPKISHIPTNLGTLHKNLVKTNLKSSSSESINTSQQNQLNSLSAGRQKIIRSESSPTETSSDDSKQSNCMKNEHNHSGKEGISVAQNKFPKTQGNIHLKRMNFERASLDSVTRKNKSINESKRTSLDPPNKTTKTVLERRMELEKLTGGHLKPSNLKKPTQISRPKCTTMKVTSFDKSSVDDSGNIQAESSNSNITQNRPVKHKVSIEEVRSDNLDTNDNKNSWVKQVVNKFQ